ncbi:MAG: HAD family hydrolase [Chloroflexota bacterium]
MAIRVIAIDVDGTLCLPNQDVTPRVRRAVAEARARGVLVLLATGRRYNSARPFAETLELDGPLVVSGGSEVCDARSGAILYETVLEPAAVERAVELVRSAGLQPLIRQRASLGHLLHTGDEQYDDEPTRSYIAVEGRVVRLPYPQLGQVADVTVVAGLSHDEALLERVAAAARTFPGLLPIVLPHAAGVLPSAVVDIFSPDAGKGRAMAVVCEQFGYDLSEVMAIGDGINDLDLLEVVGMPVAVANAIPEAKVLARAVVSSNDEDGVAEAIERFVLAQSRPIGAQ